MTAVAVAEEELPNLQISPNFQIGKKKTSNKSSALWSFGKI
jgi:hypothetical protein